MTANHTSITTDATGAAVHANIRSWLHHALPAEPLGRRRANAYEQGNPTAPARRPRAGQFLTAYTYKRGRPSAYGALTAGIGTATSGTPAWVLLGAVGIPAAQMTLICTQNSPNFNCPYATAASTMHLGMHRCPGVSAGPHCTIQFNFRGAI